MFKSKHEARGTSFTFISTIIKIKLNYNIIDINTEFAQKHRKVSIASDATLWAEPWLLKKRMGGASTL